MKKKFTLPPIIRVVSIVFLMFICTVKMNAQIGNSAVLTWDKEVGCINYDDEITGKEKLKEFNLLEEVGEGACIRFCEGSSVQYIIRGINVTNIHWQVNGGTLLNSNNASASVKWGENGNGSITFTIHFTDNTVLVRTVCIEKIIAPDARFVIDGPDPQQREFCTGTAISFDNTSDANEGSAIVHYFWDFGDGTSSNLFEPTHTYTSEGDYRVRLLATNSCNCSSVYEMTVVVKKSKPLEISCTNVTCENQVETYTVNDDCHGEWQVSGGTILSENGNSIEVIWDNVDPIDGFGYVSYRSDCSCPYWTTVKIPVVLVKGIIKGPNKACQGKQTRFTLPQWPTTDFTWKLYPEGTNTTIVLTDQRNEIVINAVDVGDYMLHVEYNNTLYGAIGCKGIAKHQFTVVESVSIITDNVLTLCQGTKKSFRSSTGNAVQWEISLNNQVVHSEFDALINYSFNEHGSFIVTANNLGCLSDPVIIDVVKTPEIIGTISGPTKVCLAVPYVYTISEQEAEALYVWSVTGGSIVGNNQGTQVEIAFNNAIATVSVVKQYVRNGVTCSSLPIYYKVEKLIVNPVIENDSGLSLFCSSATYKFTANLGGIDVDRMSWSLTPSNFGNIISGNGTNQVTVSLNELSGLNTTGTLRLTTVKCGETKTLSYLIKLVAIVPISIGTIGNICPENAFFEVPIISQAPANPDSTLYFEYGEGSTYSMAYTGARTYRIPQRFINNTPGSVGNVLKVTLRNPYGCGRDVTAIKDVVILPKNKASLFILAGSPRAVCENSPFEVKLMSTILTGLSSSSTFSWFKVERYLDEETSTFIETVIGNPNFTLTNENYLGAGRYYVLVKDVNGCETRSDEIVIYNSCSGGGVPSESTPCPLPFDPIPKLSYVWSDCSTVSVTPEFSNVSPYDIEEVKWEISPIKDGTNVLPSTSNSLGVFEIPKVGSYTIVIKVRYTNCNTTYRHLITVNKHYEPIMLFKVTCSGNNLYSVKLMNNSEMFNIDSNTVNIAYLDSNNTIVGSGNNAVINGVGPGTHIYKMRLSSSVNTLNGTPMPVCETSVKVIIDGPPPLNFTIPGGLTYCTEEAVTLRLPNGVFNPEYDYEWFFNGTSFIASGVDTAVNFALPSTFVGSFPVFLRVYNQYKCMFESMIQTVTIRKANFEGGSISPSPADFCENNTIPLTYNGPVRPSAIIWMNDENQVSTSMSYTPIKSGSYWPILIDSDGCKYSGMVTTPKIYMLRKLPYASINGNTSVCYGGSTFLTGIVTDPLVEHRWVGSNLPATYSNWVVGTTNLSLNLNNLSPGNYSYTFESRYAYDTACVKSFTSNVVVHPQIPVPTISYSLVRCQPYTLRLTASGPNNGIYNWSNGARGQSILVNIGGAYSVTYTAPTGCGVKGSVQVPHNPERSLWIVPSGCYKFCLDGSSYLLGPLGIYPQYSWLINEGVVQNGTNTSVPNQSINMAGSYQLQIMQFGCIFKSKTLHISPRVENCPTRPCGIQSKITYKSEGKTGDFIYEMSFYNPNNYTMNINISSFNNYGVFSPGTLVLTPGWNIFNQISFHPNGNFVSEASDYVMIQMPGCMDLYEIKTPRNNHGRPGETELVLPTLNLSPNPALDSTIASFDLGDLYQNAQSIVIYDITGVQRAKVKVNGSRGDISLNVSQLASGTYIVSLEADGKRILQHKLIKK